MTDRICPLSSDICPLPQCWEEDLNLRRLSRQIYSLLPLAARASQRKLPAERWRG